MHKLKMEYFINQSNIIHNYKYDYSMVLYHNMKTKVKIICPIHGEFEQIPSNHYKNGCKKCSIISRSDKLRTSRESFINKCKNIHNNKYDYSLVNYINNIKKIKIICPIHGEFEQKPYHHLNGRGCPNCSNNKRLTTVEFINKSKNIHGNKYDYSLVEYKNAHTKVKIICPDHGQFEQSSLSHLNGCGCPNCSYSKGERTISTFLKNNNIDFEYQKSFQYCIDKRKLKFDFYLPNHNICIEFDGEQHFKSIKWFGGENGLKSRQNRDNIKNKYCQINNIYLLRIKHNDDIFNILNKKIIENEQIK